MAVKGDRITLEADANARCEAIYDLLDEVGKSVRLRTFNVSQVELAALVGRQVQAPFPRLAYKDAMEWYGSDKPDTRCQVRIQDVTGLFVQSEFNLFRAAAESQGQRRVRGLFFAGEKAGDGGFPASTRSRKDEDAGH